MIVNGLNHIDGGKQPFGVSSERAEFAVAEVGLLAHQTLRNGGAGQVVAVFERCFYAVLDDHWVCVGSKELGSGPLHVLCKNWRPHRVIRGSKAAVIGTVLYVDDEPFASCDAASVWMPERAPKWVLSGLRVGLAVADEFWSKTPAEEGLAALGRAEPLLESPRLITAAEPGVSALVRVIDGGLQGCPPTLEDCAQLPKLIGLGPGLTPSGDDLLGGTLIALAAFGFLDARNMLWDGCRQHLDRTNEISRAHLGAAALGCGAAALHTAIHATMNGRVDLIGPALSAVSAIGHTSGRDAFAGALIVLRAIERHFEGDHKRIGDLRHV